MSVLRAYLDDSGDPSQQWLTIAGFSFAIRKRRNGDGSSAEFEREWKEALDYAGIPYLHMKEMNKGKSPFKQLKENKEREETFFRSAVNIIMQNIDACVGSSVRISDLNSFNEKHGLSLDPYAVGIYGCLLNFRQAPANIHNDKIEVLVDRFPKSRKRINLAFDYEETDNAFKGESIAFSKVDMLDPQGFKSVFELQAADFLAWELNRRLRDTSGFNPSYEVRQNNDLLRKAEQQFDMEYEQKHGKKPRKRQSYPALLKCSSSDLI